jgi:hypothetical protein
VDIAGTEKGDDREIEMDDLVYKTTTQPVTEPAETPASWWEWTDRRIGAELEAMTESIGQILCEERRRNEQVCQKAIEPLQHQLAELKGQISTLILLAGAKPADLKSAIEAAKTPGPAGPRGPAGPKGSRGLTGPSIVGWAVDRERYLAYPLMSHGRPGPALELRALFERFLVETSSPPT